jgi:hypothetical protein
MLMLMLFGYDLSIIALIGVIMLIGIVKKNGIMMVDFALTAEHEQNLPPEKAIYQACVLRFRPIMMTTMCAILGGLPLMLMGGPWLGIPPAARLCHGRRPHREPGADAVHDTGGLPLSRSRKPLAQAAQ